MENKDTTLSAKISHALSDKGLLVSGAGYDAQKLIYSILASQKPVAWERNSHGYPQDDAVSMQQGDLTPQSDNLDIWYTSQFVQNETVNPSSVVTERKIVKYEPIGHAPILSGTLVGTVYDGTTPVQTFEVRERGEFVFLRIGLPSNYIEKAAIDLPLGEVVAEWHDPVQTNHLVVSYEYNMG